MIKYELEAASALFFGCLFLPHTAVWPLRISIPSYIHVQWLCGVLVVCSSVVSGSGCFTALTVIVCVTPQESVSRGGSP